MRPIGIALVLSVCGCAVPAPPPPEGLVPEEMRKLESPGAAIRERLDALGPLVQELPDPGEPPLEQQARIERLAREVAQIATLPAFDEMPITANAVRARALAVAVGPRARRLEALDEARRLARALPGMEDAP